MTLEDLAALGLFKNDQTGDTGRGARVLRRATARIGGYDRPVFETHAIRFQLAGQPADECYSVRLRVRHWPGGYETLDDAVLVTLMRRETRAMEAWWPVVEPAACPPPPPSTT